MTAQTVPISSAPAVRPVPASAALALSADRAERIAEVLKALSDPVRVRLYHHISANCCSSVCVCHIPDDLGVSQPTLSYHLGRLIKAGLITKEMRGKWAHYTATPDGLDAVRGYLGELVPVAPGGSAACACDAPGAL